MNLKNFKAKVFHSPFFIFNFFLLLTLLAIAAGLLFGATSLSFDDPMTRGILLMRATRVATAFTVGAGLAISGVIMQAVMRNPLAEPYILGVSSGGGLGAAAVIAHGVALLNP